MRKFKFKLKTPLKVKRLREKMSRQQLASAIARENQEKRILRLLHKEKSNLDADMQKSLRNFIKVDELYKINNYLLNLDNKIKLQGNLVSKAKKNCHDSRLSFIKSKKERQILEKIKQKTFTLYMQEASREEQKSSDEIAISNFCRREVE